MRKFEILSIEGDPSGPGPDRAWKIFYKAIENKKWVRKSLWVIARNLKEAKEEAERRFGGKD